MSQKIEWPAWRYGPNGASDVFGSESEVPAGWADHPSKVGDKPKPAPVTAPAATPVANNASAVDAHGWPFDASLHAATRSRTKDDLWRMKVGVKRPDPKPVLDL